MNYPSIPKILPKALKPTATLTRSTTGPTIQLHRSLLNRNLVIRSHHHHLRYLNLNLNSFQGTRNFSTSSIQEWKSIGTVKKNRKTRSKLKTHQGAAKRFFVTGRGQFKRVQAGTQHLMTGVRNERKRRLKPMIIVNKSHSNLLRKLLPYAGKRAGFRKLDESETVWWKSGKLQKTGDALQLAIKRAQKYQLLSQQSGRGSKHSVHFISSSSTNSL